MDLQGAVAVITGAGSGLGYATALRFAHQGAKIMVVDRDAKAGQAVVDELGDAAAFCAGDVTRTDQVRAAVDTTVMKFGRIDILVNCAGTGSSCRTITKDGPHDLDLFRQIVEINLVGTFDMIRQSAFKMAANQPDENGLRGVIVNTASVAATDGQIGQAAYAASKAGVAGMTLPIARDLSGVGIRICTIAPGIFDTPLFRSAVPEKFRESLGASIPSPKRTGKPEEFALLAEQIVRNNYLNGETIRLDGALRMGPK